MKLIAIWTGAANNELALARLIAHAGARVVFLVWGLRQRTEIWEGDVRTYIGRERPVVRLRPLDDSMLGQISGLLLFLRTMVAAKGRCLDLLIVESSRATYGLLMRRLGLAKKMVLVLTDYLPEVASGPIRWHRRLVNRLLHNLAARADEVWMVSPRIPAAQANPNHHVMPIYIDLGADRLEGDRQGIVYIGFPSPDHALDILFDLAKKHEWRLDIIGDSPYLRAIAHTAPPTAKLHGIIIDRDKIARIMQKCFCGYAIYRNTRPDSYSYYGVPSKLFYYFSTGLPVVTTDTAFFSARVREQKLGHLVEPMPDHIEAALLDLQAHRQRFHESIVAFRRQWNTKGEEFLHARMAHLLGDEKTRQCIR